FCVFFFQAEDGIRDRTVTGVQTCALPILLLRQLSAEADAVETILFRDGKLTEASASNVFIVKRGVIQSPPKNELILPGITYDVVVELARANALPLEFRDLTEADVRGADELWVTSSS